jgi:hypothetical protein
MGMSVSRPGCFTIGNQKSRYLCVSGHVLNSQEYLILCHHACVNLRYGNKWFIKNVEMRRESEQSMLTKNTYDPTVCLYANVACSCARCQPVDLHTDNAWCTRTQSSFVSLCLFSSNNIKASHATPSSVLAGPLRHKQPAIHKPM